MSPIRLSIYISAYNLNGTQVPLAGPEATQAKASVLVWPLTPASSRPWSRQDGGATTKSGKRQRSKSIDTPEAGQ